MEGHNVLTIQFQGRTFDELHDNFRAATRLAENIGPDEVMNLAKKNIVLTAKANDEEEPA